MGIFCGICGNENRIDAAYCKICDANLQKYQKQEVKDKEPIQPTSALRSIFIILAKPKQSEIAYKVKINVFLTVYIVLLSLLYTASYLEEMNTFYRPPVFNPTIRAGIKLAFEVGGLLLGTILLTEIIRLTERQRIPKENNIFSIMLRMNIVSSLCYVPYFLAKILLLQDIQSRSFLHKASGIFPRRTEILSTIPFPPYYNTTMIIALVIGALLSARILYNTLRHVIGIESHVPFLLAMISFAWVVFVRTLPYIQ